MNSSMTAVTPAAVIKIKKESPGDDVKAFAENTMNELLGWYGFDVERLDVTARTSRLAQAARNGVEATANAAVTISAVGGREGPPLTDAMADSIAAETEAAVASIILPNRRSSASAESDGRGHHDDSKMFAIDGMTGSGRSIEKKRNRAARTSSAIQQRRQKSERDYMKGFDDDLPQHYPNLVNNIAKDPCTSQMSKASSQLQQHGQQGQRVTMATNNDSGTSDHDTYSSRDDDDSKSPSSFGANGNKMSKSLSRPIGHNAVHSAEDKIDTKNCCWCHRLVPENAPEYLTTTDGPRYCSESCFTQSRRASFKKAKTCDWCKHIRHAVSYVDFQDGASQLQFCSNKCLNQYKMQIFCKETQAHLDMNPHLKEQGLDAANNGAALITPDLWLKNCRSRSASPASTISLPGSPTAPKPQQMSMINSLNQPSSSNANLSLMTPLSGTVKTTTHKPLITVAPVDKLMSAKSLGVLDTTPTTPTTSATSAMSTGRLVSQTKHCRKKRPMRVSCITSTNDNKNSKKNSTATIPSNSQLNAGALFSKTHLRLSPRDNFSHHSNPSPTTSTLTDLANSGAQDIRMNVPPLSPILESAAIRQGLAAFASKIRDASNIPDATTFRQRPPPPPYLPNTPRARLPTLPATTVRSSTQTLSDISPFIGATPPVTIVVPYPVVLPIPIPIPIPLPIMNFYKAYLTPEERRKFEEQQNNTTKTEENPTNPDNSNQFTLNLNQQTESTEPEMSGMSGMPEMPVIEEPLDCTKASEVNESKDEELQRLTTMEDGPSSSNYNQIKDNKNENDPGNDGLINVDKTNEKENDKNDQEFIFGSASPTRFTLDDAYKKLPKLKITRLPNKRPTVQAKESDRSRPLRKRKRIIDCDFQKIHLKEYLNMNEFDDDDYDDDDDNDDDDEPNESPSSSSSVITKK